MRNGRAFAKKARSSAFPDHTFPRSLPIHSPSLSPPPHSHAGLAAVALGTLVGSQNYKYYVYKLQQVPLVMPILKFGVAFPLTYHYLGGLRHLAWDNIIGHNLESMAKTGYAAVAVAGAVSVVAAFTEFDEES